MLGTAVALAALPRRRGDYADFNRCLLITLAALLAATGVLGQVVVRLQCLPTHIPIDWKWFRNEIGRTVVENLVWPLCALLPAVGLHLNQRKTQRNWPATWLMLSLLFGIASAAAAIIGIAVLFRIQSGSRQR